MKVAFDITVQTFSWADVTGPQFRLGEAVDLTVGQHIVVLPSPAEQDTTVEREITIEAWVVKGEDGQYHDLAIEKVLAW